MVKVNKRLIFYGSPLTEDLAYPTDGGISSPLCASTPNLTPPHAELTQSYRAREEAIFDNAQV